MKLSALKAFIPGKVMVAFLITVISAAIVYFMTVQAKGDHLVQRNFHYLNQIASNIERSLIAVDSVVKFRGKSCDQSSDSFKKFSACMEKVLKEVEQPIAGGRITQLRSTPSDHKCSEPEGDDKDSAFSIEKQSSKLEGNIIVMSYEVCLGSNKDSAETLILHYDILNRIHLTEDDFNFLMVARYDGTVDSPAIVIADTGNIGEQAPDTDIRQLFRVSSEPAKLRNLADLEFSNAIDQMTNLAALGGVRVDSSKRKPFSRSELTSVEIAGNSYLGFVQPITLSALEDQRDFLLVGFIELSKFNEKKFTISYNFLYFMLLTLISLMLIYTLVHLYFIGKTEILKRRNPVMAYLSVLGLQTVVILIYVQVISSYQFSALYNESKWSIFQTIRQEFATELTENIEKLKAEEPKLKIQDPSKENEILFEGQLPAVENYFQLDCMGKQTGLYRTNQRDYVQAGFQVADREYFKRIVNQSAWRMPHSSSEASTQSGQIYFLERIESMIDGSIQTALSIPASDITEELGPLHKYCFKQSEHKKTDDHASEIESHPVVTVLATSFMSLSYPVLPVGFDFAIFDNRSGNVLYHSVQERNLRENFYRAVDGVDDSERLKAVVISGADTRITLKYKGDDIKAAVGPLMRDVPWTLVVFYRKTLLDVVKFHFGVAGGIQAFILLAAALAFAIVIVLLLQKFVGPRSKYASLHAAIDLPHWMRPAEKWQQEYRRLNIYYLAVLPLYVCIMFFVDSSHLSWYFAGSVLSLLIWHREIRADLYRRNRWTKFVGFCIRVLIIGIIAFAVFELLSIGARSYALAAVVWLLAALLFQRRIYIGELQKLRRGSSLAGSSKLNRNRENGHSLLRTYCGTLALFGLLSSFVPTLIVLNQNYALHEKMWVDFSNWSNIDRLNARYKYYLSDTRNIRFRASLTELLLKNWRGVYLPRTELFSMGDDGVHRHSRNRLLIANQGGEYDRSYLLATKYDPLGKPADLSIELSKDKQECHFKSKKSQPASLRFDDEYPTNLDSDSLSKIMARLAPNFETTEELLEGFGERLPIGQSPVCSAIEVQGVMPEPRYFRFDKPVTHPLQDDESDRSGSPASCSGDSGGLLCKFGKLWRNARYGHPEANTCGPIDSSMKNCDPSPFQDRIALIEKITGTGYLFRLFRSDIDPDANIEYRALYWFPHTRPLNTGMALFGFLFIAVVIGRATYWVNRMLMKRFFYNFSEWKPKCWNGEKARELDTRSILVVPPGERPPMALFRTSGNSDPLDAEQVVRRWAWSSAWSYNVDISQKIVVAYFSPDDVSDSVLPPQAAQDIQSWFQEDYKIIIVTDVDLSYWLQEALEEKRISAETYKHWTALICIFETWYYKPLPSSTSKPMGQYYHKYFLRCTRDERMVLAGLLYEGRVNPTNSPTTHSLYRRGLIIYRDFNFRLRNPGIGQVVQEHFPEDEFRKHIHDYGNSQWLTWRKPIVLVLFLLVVFVLFLAKEQLGNVYSLMATIGTLLATFSIVGDRVRTFSTAFFSK